MNESDRILKEWFEQIDGLISARHSKSFLTNKAMIGVGTGGKVDEAIDAQTRANEQTTAATEQVKPGRVYVVRVYRYKARKHRVTFLGIGVRTKKPDLTNIQNAKLFEYETAAKIIADTPSVDGVQYHILLHSDAVEREKERANRK